MGESARALTSIKVDQAQLDQRHCYSYPILVETLTNSISAHGVLNPISLYKDDDGFLKVISGFRRFESARTSGIKEVDAFIIGSPDHHKLFIEYLSENISHRKPNLVECSKMIKTAIDNFGFDHKGVMEKILPMLGYAKSGHVITALLEVSGFGAEASSFLYQSGAQISLANLLCGVGDLQREVICRWLIKHRFNLNRSTKMIEMIIDLSQINGLTPNDVIGRAEGDATPSTDDKTRANKLFDYLLRWRNPTLSDMEKLFNQNLSALSLPRHVEIKPPANFEGSTLDIRIKVKSMEEIKSVIYGLSLADDKALNSLFKWL